MAAIIEFRLPTEEFTLEETFNAHPEAQIEIERVVADDPDQWEITGAAANRRGPTIEQRVEQLEATANTRSESYATLTNTVDRLASRVDDLEEWVEKLERIDERLDILRKQITVVNEDLEREQ